MGTGSHSPHHDHRIYADLHSYLVEQTMGVHQDKTATALLRLERSGWQLVGLLDGLEDAVYYSPNARRVVSMPFDRHGVCESERESLWGPVGDAASWVDANVETLAWVHPELRWVLDLTTEDSVWGFYAERPSGD